jgi:hypothetical protein
VHFVRVGAASFMLAALRDAADAFEVLYFGVAMLVTSD